jgi:site-specific DNA-methyltransferase (adenine-specific)
MFTLINDNSLNVMATMSDNSVDVCITDPPYGLTHLDGEFNNFEDTASSGGSFAGKPGGGMAFTKDQNANTALFLAPFFVEAFRILKPGAFCVVFSQGRLLLGVLNALDSAGFEIREQFYWRKPSALPNQQTPFKKNTKVRVDTDRLILGPGKVVEPFVIAQKPREGSYATNFNTWGTGLVDKDEATTTVFDCLSASKQESKGCLIPQLNP